MRRHMFAICTIMMLVLSVTTAFAAEPNAAESIKTLTSIGREGKDNAAAATAWKSLVANGGSALLPALGAIDKDKAASANWLRTAVDAIAEAEIKAGRKLPIQELATFCEDARRDPAARRLAYELVQKVDKAVAAKLLPKFINDPSLELRRDAIQQAFDELRAKQPSPAAADLEPLFAAARDKDQVEKIGAMAALKKTPEQISQHFGYITQWHVIGPFANEPAGGFVQTHAPEKGIELLGKYPGGKNGPVTWKAVQSDAAYGSIDLNATLGKHKDATAYASATIDAPEETPAELRAATKNAIRMFVNGKLVFEREEYHHGARMDQHTARIVLKKGKNEIILKLCQNNQEQSWAQDWTFSARICDATGGKLNVKQELPGDKPALVELGRLAEKKKSED